MPTLPKASFSTRRIGRRKKNSETRLKSACSPNMVARSTWRNLRRSCYWVRRRSTSSTLGLVKSFMGRNEQRRGQNTPKMVRPHATFDLLQLTDFIFITVYVNNHTSVWGSWYNTA